MSSRFPMSTNVDSQCPPQCINPLRRAVTAFSRRRAADIAAVAELGEEAMGLLRPEIAPPDYVALLMSKKLYADAVRFVAHALPKREAVWWGWISAKRAAGRGPSAQNQGIAGGH
jgi:hypothetical protein